MKGKCKQAFFLFGALNFLLFSIVSRFVTLEGTNIGSWILLFNAVLTYIILNGCPDTKSSSKSQFNDEFLTLWESKKPIEVTFKADHETKSTLHRVIRYVISPNSNNKLFCIDENNQIIKIDEDDIETKLIYKSKRYDIFYDVLKQVIGNEKVMEIQEEEIKLLGYLEEIREEERLYAKKEDQAREDSKKVIYSFSPKELKFSIYGDYFDQDLPPNHLRITLLCDGLYGYPDTKEVLALTGFYAQTGKPVNIRINAIVTMIGFDGKKYSCDEFLALAKTFNQ